MTINEVTNFNGQVVTKDSNGADVVVAYLNANLDAGSMNLSINMNVTNKVLLIANSADSKQQYTDFITAVQSRATELGYVIF